MAELPLEQRESDRLEFKGKDALKDLSRIGREVVAMLNAQGGEIWIGIREDNGIAVEVEPLADVERERQRLRDFLCDAVEPAPDSEEVQVETVPENRVLRLRVRPREDRKPYALLRKEGRFFVTRIGDRLRPMARGEIEEAFRRGKGTDPAAEDVKRREKDLVGEIEELRKQDQGGSGNRSLLWLALQPVEALEVDLQEVERAPYLRDPEASGSRRIGLTVASFMAQASISRTTATGLIIEEPEVFRLAVGRDAGLRVELTMDALVGPLPNDPRCLDGSRLVELVASCLRVAGRILGDAVVATESAVSDARPVLSHLALLGIRGVKLRPGAAWTSGGGFNVQHAFEKPHAYEDDDLILDRPLRFPLREIRDEPDHCTYRLMRLVYEAFDLREDALPKEFDPVTRRLVLPE